jgi:hypothetical protein
MSEYSSAQAKKENIVVRWDMKVLLAIAACFFLAGGISAVVNAVSYYSADPSSLNLAQNWLEWITAFSFLLGWLFAHGIEIAVLKRQIELTRILVFIMCIVLLFVPWFIPTFTSNPLFQFFDCVIGFAFGGFFFRYSMYQKEALRTWPDVLFGKRKGA